MKNMIIKKLCSCLITSFFFATFLFIQQNGCVLADVKSGQEVDTEEVLVFLKDVVGYDFTKYEARLRTNSTTYWSWMGGVALTTGQYVLDATTRLMIRKPYTSILSVSFIFGDEHLSSMLSMRNRRSHSV
jgi:hypothetical protein